MEIAYQLAVALAASFVHTLTGFGFALVLLSTLVVVVEAKSAVILVHILYLVLGSVLVWLARRDIDRPLLMNLLLSSFVGLPLGAYVLVIISESLLRLLIGFFIVLAALLLLFNYQRPFRHEQRVAVVVGFLGGFLNAIVTVCGPFVVLFLANQKLPKERLRATISAFLLGTSPVALSIFFAAGLVTPELLSRAAVLMPACIVGYLLGMRLLPAVSPEAFRRTTVVLVLLAGTSILVAEAGRLLHG